MTFEDSELLEAAEEILDRLQRFYADKEKSPEPWELQVMLDEYWEKKEGLE
jgi:hypothetical protein